MADVPEIVRHIARTHAVEGCRRRVDKPGGFPRLERGGLPIIIGPMLLRDAMPRFSALRAGVVMAVMAAALAGMTVRVAYLQTYGRQKTILSAIRQQHRNETIAARRGSIFDAAGNAMAMTVQTMNVYIDPQFLDQGYQREGRNPARKPADLRRLAEILDQDPVKFAQLVHEKQDSEYLKIAENVGERACQEIRKLNIPGVGFEPIGTRFYPMGAIASHVLGTVGKEGNGLEGLELRFDKELIGKNGWRRVEKDAKRRPIGVDTGDYVPPAHGQALVLTIDANIQMIAQQELAAACMRHRAKRGEVIVIDPQTGDVLAMCNWPTFNPQNLEDSNADLRRNRCLTDPYEPGSTLKPFVMGPALAWGVTQANHVWPIRNPYVLPYGRTVKDVSSYPPLTSWDVLVKSSNVGMCMLAEKMGQAKLHQALSIFRFGRTTGIELGGEDPGLVYPLKKWTRASTESVAQGYEMMVTPLQIARAFCVYANGGHLVKPRIIKGVLDADGNVVSRQPTPRLQEMPVVMEEQAAGQMRQILSDVVVRGTAAGYKLGRSKYWNIFGKTGTAHISRGRAGYAADKINGSFICGAPYENPRIVVAFIIHEPDRATGRFGGSVSAPGAKQLVDRVLAYMQVPESPPLGPPAPNIAGALVGFNIKVYGGQTASARN